MEFLEHVPTSIRKLVEQAVYSVSSINFRETVPSKARLKLRDPNFGFELQYALGRAFSRPPYAEGGDLVGLGNVSHLTSEKNNIAYHIEVKALNREEFGNMLFVPFVICGWNEYELSQTSVFVREFWKGNREHGIEIMRLRPFVYGWGNAVLTPRPEDWDLFKTDSSSRGFIIELTGSFNIHPHRPTARIRAQIYKLRD